jgi:hypothetical protein
VRYTSSRGNQQSQRGVDLPGDQMVNMIRAMCCALVVEIMSSPLEKW